jgi:4-hydroxyacetophenone monooxygenase
VTKRNVHGGLPITDDDAEIAVHSECQMRYISGCVKALLRGDHKAMEPTRAAHDDYVQRNQKELEGRVWSHPPVEHSWTNNAEGKVHISSPWRLVDYWNWTREPNLDHYEIA